jgi:hypothetical protein
VYMYVVESQLMRNTVPDYRWISIHYYVVVNKVTPSLLSLSTELESWLIDAEWHRDFRRLEPV